MPQENQTFVEGVEGWDPWKVESSQLMVVPCLEVRLVGTRGEGIVEEVECGDGGSDDDDDGVDDVGGVFSL